MATLPGIPGEFFFGFKGDRQPLRLQRQQPESRRQLISSIVGFDTASLDSPRVHQGTPDNNPELLTSSADDFGDLAAMPPMLRNGQPMMINVIPDQAAAAALLRIADGCCDSMAAMARTLERMADNASKPQPVHITMPKQPRVKSIRRDKEGNMIGVNYSEED
jgi:hypothetical protein